MSRFERGGWRCLAHLRDPWAQLGDSGHCFQSREPGWKSLARESATRLEKHHGDWGHMANFHKMSEGKLGETQGQLLKGTAWRNP